MSQSGQTPAPGHGPAPVVYIGGWGRSGSTLVECLLAELPGVVVLGEVVHLWERGLRLDQRCACGSRFHECPFWTRVGEEAFGGWDAVDLDRVLALQASVDRQRHLLRTLRRRPPREVREQVLEYAGYYHRIYEAARALTGARVVVDSSKEVPTAVALAHHPDIDLRVLHVVRDSRGAAYSWSKTVSRPETETGEPMPRFSPARSTLFWLSGNLSVSGTRYLGARLARLRYEDLVDRPAGTLRSTWARLDLPGEADLPMLGPHTVELHGTHSVAGNPMRFATGSTELRPDTSWQTKMPPRDRRLVTAMSYPVLKAFGYRVRPRPGSR